MRRSGRYSGRVVSGSEMISKRPRDESTGSATNRQPVRTCVGCKVKVPSVDLLRVVVRPSCGESRSFDWVAVPDVHHTLHGRGAWLHLVPQCLDNAERRRAFGRALRVSGSVDTSEVAAFIEGAQSECGNRNRPEELHPSTRTGNSTDEHTVKHQR